MTVQTMLFEIPYGQWHRTALVLLGKILSESNAWRWIEGKLEPPSNFVDSARIAKGVSKVLGRGKPNAETVPANAKVDWGLQHPQFFVLEGLAESPPRHENSCELALIYAITAVEFAYSGTMTIYQVEPSRGFPWQAWVQINEHITIAWDETRGGTRAGLEPIIEVCQALELRELTPAA